MKRSAEQERAAAAILGIGTAVPPYRIIQAEASERLAEALGEHSKPARWAKKIFHHCGVETRYTCESNLLERAGRCRYVPSAPLHDIPTTAERMEKYKEHSVPLGLEAARKALQVSGMAHTDITHLITVSCTGQVLPGLDVALIRELGLAPDVDRIPLTFMGCAAGLTAVRMAAETVRRCPDAGVLIVCVELCTLHIQPSGEREALFAAAFFGDGASACVVGKPGDQRNGIFVLGRHRTAILPDSEEEMVWSLGNFGFRLYLSPDIPQRVGETVPPEVERLLGEEQTPELWAIHPGGRGIIDTLQAIYRLSDAQTRASRSVLRQYGNLSSATILFVLEAMGEALRDTASGPKEGIALAFGPGMNAEMMLFTYVPSASANGAVPAAQAQVEAHA